MPSNRKFALAGAVALTFGLAPLALAQNPSNPVPPQPSYPASSTMPASSPTATTTSSMSSGTAMSSQSAMTKSTAPNLTHSQVTMLQKALRGLGYYIKVDGVWGQGTRDDVMDVQFKNGLKVSGYPDADTLRALGIPNWQQGPGSQTMTPSSGT